MTAAANAKHATRRDALKNALTQFPIAAPGPLHAPAACAKYTPSGIWSSARIASLNNEARVRLFQSLEEHHAAANHIETAGPETG
jgi:hypothetical protein